MPQSTIMNLTLPNLAAFEPYTDSRTHGYQGPSRYVRLPRVSPPGPAAISKNEDGTRCVVAGKESLRIVRILGPGQPQASEHKSAQGPGGHRLEASRNFWDSSGLKVDNASTDVAWGHGLFNNKILTSARSGELIMWDINRSGGAKYERRSKDHTRSINTLSVSPVVHYYCITGSADGDMRIWDLRDLSKSLMKVRIVNAIRSLVFSPCVWQPLQAVVGLDTGSIQRWDLKMGQRGNLDRLNVAHIGVVTSLDWCSSTASSNANGTPVMGPAESTGNGLGWVVSGGHDKTVKVWDLTSPGTNTHMPSRPTYILHPTNHVKHVAWRPGYGCEVAVVMSDDVLASNLDGPGPGSSTPTPGLLSRVQSGLGLDTMLKSFNPDALSPLPEKIQNTPIFSSMKPQGRSGETVEIWDVRRAWVPKWSLNRASSEGSIVDITFGDSHAMVAQYNSGTFAQLDLRECTRPIVSINRVATTWDVAGSLTFAANKPSRWDPPYDDLLPQERNGERNTQAHKQLGDPPIKLKSQALSTFIQEDANEDLEIFVFLAKNYRFYGDDKKQLCLTNAETALQAGDERASQIWRLLGATLEEFVPPPPPPVRSPHPRLKPLPPSHPQAGYHFPAAPNNYSFPGNTVDSPSNKWSPGGHVQNSNPNQLAIRSRSPSAARRLTPSSSKSNSPMHIPVPLPVTPNRTNMFNRRQSVDSGSAYRQASAFRRPSLAPFQHSNSASPNERTPSVSRHVGEGALDDSSSSDGREEPHDHPDSDEERPHALVSPSPNPGKHLVTPSPLSRVVKQQSSEEENDPVEDVDDEVSSASPRSTDTESDGSSHSRRQAKSRSSRRASLRIKTRSRSSTIASLAAPPRLVHQDSFSSIRTVTAGESGLTEKQTDAGPQPLLETPSGSGLHHRRHKSQPVPEFIPEISSESSDEIPYPSNPKQDNVSQRRIEVVRAEEKRFREIAWSALRKVLDDFLDEGDVQMGAVMCLIAHEEMKLTPAKVVRVVDAYLDRLMRLRLYTSAAFIRKYSKVEAVQKKSLVETVIYTSCAGCGKPIARPVAKPLSTSRPFRGAFAYCLSCRKPIVRCSICHLPVRALLFQCSICQHGGHQSCFRRYYMEHPMVELPTSFLPSEDRGRSLNRMVQQERLKEEDSDATSIMSARSESSVLGTSAPSPTRTESSNATPRVMGHPCASGCGHFCWAANMLLDGKEPQSTAQQPLDG